MLYKEFKYYLIETDGRSISVVNGVVTSTSSQKALLTSPDGWQQISVGWERNLTKYGINRNFTLPLDFYFDGGTILRNTFYKENIEREIWLLIQQLELDITDTTFRYIYRYFYKGELDFSTLKDDGVKVSINIMEGGLSKKLKANEATTYELPVATDPEAITVKMDGHFMTEKHAFFIPDDPIVPLNRLLGIQFLNKEGNAAGFASFSIIKQAVPGDYSTSTEYFFTTSQDIDDIAIKGTIEAASLAGGILRLKIKNQAGTTVATLVDVDPSDNAFHVYSFDVTIDANAGDKFFLVSESGIQAQYHESLLNIEFRSRYRTTYIKAYFPDIAYKKLGAKSTGFEADWHSDLLAANRRIAITSGDAMRSIVGAKLKTSVNKFFEDYNVPLCAGMGIENEKIVLEARSHFFDESNPVDLGEVKDWESSLATDLMANTLKIGWTAKSTEDVNGKYAFNNTHVYTSPITRVVKEHSIVSGAITDPYAIELLRINLEGKTTTDDSADNDVILLDIDTDNVDNKDYEADTLLTQGYTGTNSIIYDTVVGDYFSSNTAKTEFTFTPTTQKKVDINLVISFTSGGLVNLRVLRNAEILSEKQVEAVHPTGLNVQGVTLNPGDVIKVTVEPIGAITTYTVTGSTLTIDFTEETIYSLRREAYDSVEGVPSPETIFNIFFSPKRCLLRHGYWIRSMFWSFESSKLVFQTTEKNPLLKTVQAGVTIEEDADINISSLDAGIFIPKYFDGGTQVPAALVELLEENPNRCFRFVWEGDTYLGFNTKIAIAPNTMQEQKFKLLSTASNDLSKLVV